jgi:hypothetical protein
MRQQGETARRQLDNSEAAQRADLIIENFKVMDFPTAPNGMPYATFTVRNVGNTVANEIDITTSARVQSSVNPKELGKALEANIKIAPSPSGWSLAPGRSRSNFNVQFELGPETSQLLAMKRSVFAFVVEVTVSYRDIFKRAHRTSDCLIYDPLYRDFNPCVQGHHRD